MFKAQKHVYSWQITGIIKILVETVNTGQQLKHFSSLIKKSMDKVLNLLKSILLHSFTFLDSSVIFYKK